MTALVLVGFGALIGFVAAVLLVWPTDRLHCERCDARAFMDDEFEASVLNDLARL